MSEPAKVNEPAKVEDKKEEGGGGGLIWVVETGVTRRTLVDILHGLDDVDTRTYEKSDKKDRGERIYSTMFSPNTVRPLIERQDNKYVVAMTSAMCDRLLGSANKTQNITVNISPYRRHPLRDFPSADVQFTRSLYVVLPPFMNDGKNDFRRHMNCVQWNLYQKLEELSKIGMIPPQSYRVIFRHRDVKIFAFINFSKTVTDDQIIDCRIMIDHSLWRRNTFPRCICRFARPSPSKD